ncbi:UDP-glucose 4-epimerase GalE [Phaeocystidibacter luteus]|uniref:UDP-glucose 4-epimerase n=1 Tax=Phaeocystidibacter luteus TaxID=911197 RepID=A0A6N6RL39_9FLAO|nr:UDP-glucose 4-epimerase GalE [Phaeocystidibacter luteus]KAB2810322.1 UDP-glucose 4-epimerase GalE [Phaeocystidibacter luteus]
MSKVLVTGGLGYIGSHTVVELTNAGFTPVVLDDLSCSDLEVKGRIEKILGSPIIFEEVDMCDKLALADVFDRHPEITGVIHFAAFLLVNESVDLPLKYYRNNLFSTINLLELMSEKKVKSLVFSSSCTVYGIPDKLPVDENASIKPAESPYGNTKKMGEDIIRDAALAHDLKCISLRYFNPIGAHDSGIIGEFQDGEPHHLVPYITETAIGKRSELKVFGGDYDTRDGTCVRDYIHVVDIARAHVNAIEQAMKTDALNYDVINLGSGNGSTVLEMIHAFQNATGIDIPHSIVARREGDVPAVYADITKAKKVLGWEPQLSLETMLASAWQFEQSLTS